MTVPTYNAALYLRLSQEDELTGESSSIITQRQMLRKYADDNRINAYGEYVDDERTQWYIFNSVIISRSYRQICNKRRAFEYTLRLHLRGREPRFCQSIYGA